MEPLSSLEQALETAVSSCETLGCPPRLAAAIRYAVFPGGARIRPRLCLAIAAGCGEPHSPLAEATAASIELLHCASLVHDDLPCFDDAETRRNRPSVHRAFDERIALLVGDALIVLAFQNVARAFVEAPDRLPGIVLALARAAGAHRTGRPRASRARARPVRGRCGSRGGCPRAWWGAVATAARRCRARPLHRRRARASVRWARRPVAPRRARRCRRTPASPRRDARATSSRSRSRPREARGPRSRRDSRRHAMRGKAA